MTRETSIYLDAVRFIAASVVLLTHLNMLGNTWLDRVLPYGTQAVLAFFVLSGFVIGHATGRRDTSAAGYALARAARIGSVAFPALVATALLDLLAAAVNPDPRFLPPGYADGRWLWDFLSSALFVNQFWSAHAVPGSNFAFWSLSYEVAYYAAFGVAVFAPRHGWLGAALVLAAAGPRIASLFPVWALGLACHRVCSRAGAIGRPLGWCAFAGSAAVWAAFEVWATRRGWRAHDALVPLYDHAGWDLVQDYGLALLFAVHLVGLRAVSADLAPVLHRFERPIRWLAGATFTLYLFHLPVARFLLALLWDPAWSRAVHLAVFVGTLGVVFGVAEVTERRKAAWHRALSALVAARAKPSPTG